MFTPPPPENDDARNRFSNKPMAPMIRPVMDDAELGEESGEPFIGHGPQGDDLYLYVLSCLDRGSSRKEVRSQLIAFGHSADAAEQLVAEVAEWRRLNPDVNVPTHADPSGNGNSNMLIGGLVCLLGLVVTLGSLWASSGGGSYVIAWGAILWGGVQFFRGMAQSRPS